MMDAVEGLWIIPIAWPAVVAMSWRSSLSVVLWVSAALSLRNSTILTGLPGSIKINTDATWPEVEMPRAHSVPSSCRISCGERQTIVVFRCGYGASVSP